MNVIDARGFTALAAVASPVLRSEAFPWSWTLLPSLFEDRAAPAFPI